MVKKAVVLAAGLGTRLRPFTCAVPKPLLSVWGEPMLARIVAMLRERGVDDIVVNCHYLHEQVEAWCAANGCRASYEPEILGTGGVLNPLRDWIGNSDFYLVNGDIVMENVPELEKRKFPKIAGADSIGVCLVSATEGPRTIEVEPESRFVTCWNSPDPGWEGTYTYCGMALLKAEILKYIPSTGFSSIVDAYGKAMMDGKFVRAVESEELLWTDAGTVDSYVNLNLEGEDNGFAEVPQLKSALSALGKSEAKLEFVGARGSNRVFFKAENAIIVVYDDEKRPENAKYAEYARYLKAKGVPVPEVLYDDPKLKTLALENAGATDLGSKVRTEGEAVINRYAAVVEALAKFNALGGEADLPELQPAFDDDLWKWERGLFAEHCLGSRYAMAMPEAVEKELEMVAERLMREPIALVHRDFQSTNVIFRNEEFKFIDFQGMRKGPAIYDLASLIYDPYVELSDKARTALIALYGKLSGRSDLSEVVPFAAVQRLVQALGAFGRLASVGQKSFSVHVLPALQHLLAAADEAGLDAIGALAEDLIARETASKSSDQGKCSCGHHHHEGECCDK